MDETLLGNAHRHLAESRDAIARSADDAGFIATLGWIAERMADALAACNKILFCRNGGSAANAQHIAGELLSRFETEHAPLPEDALTTDTSVLAAIENDFGFEHVFERQVRGLGVKGDVLLAISISGKSLNVLRVFDAAREKELATIGFTGTKGADMESRCDFLLRALVEKTPVIQQIHITAAHILCGFIERRLSAER